MGNEFVESVRKNMGAALKAARIKAGITITEAAEAIGKTNSTMYSYELSRIQPTADVFLQLVLLYGIDSFDMFLPKGSLASPIDISTDHREEQEMLQLMQGADEQGKAAAKAVLQTYQRKNNDAQNDVLNLLKFIK